MPPAHNMRYTLSGEYVQSANQDMILRELHDHFCNIRGIHFPYPQTAVLDASPINKIHFPLSVPLHGATSSALTINVVTSRQLGEEPIGAAHMYTERSFPCAPEDLKMKKRDEIKLASEATRAEVEVPLHTIPHPHTPKPDLPAQDTPPSSPKMSAITSIETPVPKSVVAVALSPGTSYFYYFSASYSLLGFGIITPGPSRLCPTGLDSRNRTQ
ncbi:hypothetical protein BS47DRAFT_1050214 [Hydnum rufescens UP504]|uniref:Uncharacterized protein n=1 Tax=Hydnum rufescens UP504 TaxID=1448309 RepID=A0A9P6DW93_9AGAM|nr:hypothetical protein BS47DRAFT_1050214 [Hydnum rufescens UP504]